MQNLELRSFPLTSHLGRVLFGRFRVESLIATGSMGAVFSAWDSVRNEACAVKLLLPEMKEKHMVHRRFLDEARLISQLYHPNIVEVWNHYEEPDGTSYLVMELLAGQDLDTLLRSRGPLPLRQVLSIVKQVGSALHTVHLAGIVHRDIQPKNIILLDGSETPGPGTVKVIDFGLSKLGDPRKAPRRDSDGMLMGTPGCLPPEAFSGISADVDSRADQWALAAVTYLMLSGRRPYEPEDSELWPRLKTPLPPPIPLCEFDPQLPPHVDLVITRALSADKSQRFPTVLDFVRALHNLPPTASAASATHRPADHSSELTQLLSTTTLTQRSPPAPSNSHLETLVAAALRPSAISATTIVSNAASTVTPVLAPLPPAEPTFTYGPVRQRPASYLLPALSVLGALLAWSSILWARTAGNLPPPDPAAAVRKETCEASVHRPFIYTPQL